LKQIKIEIKRDISLVCAHEDVEPAAEVVGDLAEEVLPLVTHGDVADGACNGELHGLPLLEALAELLLLQGAGVHGRSQRHQLLHHRTPASTPLINMYVRVQRNPVVKQLYTSRQGDGMRVVRTYPMPRLPPVTRAVLPRSDHLPGCLTFSRGEASVAVSSSLLARAPGWLVVSTADDSTDILSLSLSLSLSPRVRSLSLSLSLRVRSVQRFSPCMGFIYRKLRAEDTLKESPAARK
jgi:hypothetical protein